MLSKEPEDSESSPYEDITQQRAERSTVYKPQLLYRQLGTPFCQALEMRESGFPANTLLAVGYSAEELFLRCTEKEPLCVCVRLLLTA